MKVQLIAGGEGLPEECDKGFFVRPTAFSNVTPEMKIWKEEILVLY